MVVYSLSPLRYLFEIYNTLLYDPCDLARGGYAVSGSFSTKKSGLGRLVIYLLLRYCFETEIVFFTIVPLATQPCSVLTRVLILQKAYAKISNSGQVEAVPEFIASTETVWMVIITVSIYKEKERYSTLNSAI